MIYLACSIFMLLLVISFGRYGSEVVRFRRKLAEVEAEAARLSNMLRLIMVERDELKANATGLTSKLTVLERDYTTLTKTDSVLRAVALLYDSHEDFSTLEDWRNGVAPIFSNFVDYLESTDGGIDAKLN
jgi:hypothetical protein